MPTWKDCDQLDQKKVYQLRTPLEQEITKLSKEGSGQEALVAVARCLQDALACDKRLGQYPHSPSLELIMRAVIGTLEGGLEEGHRQYIFSKLDLGVNLLGRELGRPA